MSVEKEKLDYIICGGGASGLLLLQALTQDSFFSNKKILLIEREFKKSNDRTWSFWEEPNGDFDDLLYKKWNEANFVGPKNKIEKEARDVQWDISDFRVIDVSEEEADPPLSASVHLSDPPPCRDSCRHSEGKGRGQGQGQ